MSIAKSKCINDMLRIPHFPHLDIISPIKTLKTFSHTKQKSSDKAFKDEHAHIKKRPRA